MKSISSGELKKMSVFFLDGWDVRARAGLAVLGVGLAHQLRAASRVLRITRNA